jgi:hypothetical protein
VGSRTLAVFDPFCGSGGMMLSYVMAIVVGLGFTVLLVALLR